MNSDKITELEVDLRVANFKLDVLREIIHLLPELGDPINTLGFIMNRLFSLVEMEGASIMTLDEACETLTFEIVRGEKEEELTGLVMESSKGIAGRVVSTGKPFLVDDTHKHEDFFKDIDQILGYTTRNLIAVPLKTGSKIIGVLEGVNIDVDEIASPYQLMELFEALGDIVTLVLIHFSILKKLGDDIALHNRLIDISRVVNSSLEIKDILDAVVNAATSVLDTEAASLLLLDDTGEYLRFLVAQGEKKGLLEEKKMSVKQGISGFVARTGEAQIVNDVSRNELFNASFDKLTGFQTKNILCVPMYKTGKIIGVLEAINKNDGGQFNKHDKYILENIANAASTAIGNAQILKERDHLLFGAIDALAKAIGVRDSNHTGHSEKVAFYSENIARFLLPDDVELHNMIVTAAKLHDVGKIALPDSILLKKQPLTDEEWAIVRTHSSISRDLIKPFITDEKCIAAVLHHHEGHDGSGYPDGLKGDDIPLPAAILAVANAFDDITSDRPYHEKKSPEDAALFIKDNSGILFNPDVVEAFLLAFDDGSLKLPENQT